VQTGNRIDTSLFAKPAAIIAWLVLCILTILFEKPAIGFFLGFVFLLTLSSYLWARFSLRDVDFELSVNRIGMFPGQVFTVTRIVRNRKTLPMLWADIREACIPEDCAAPLMDVIVERELYGNSENGPEKIYERLYTLSLIRWRQSVLFKDEWQAKHRGIMEIDTSLLSSGDGFGLCAEGRPYKNTGPRRIVVYPRLARTSVSGIINDMWDTRSENNGFLKDRTVIKSVRDYLPGDAARDVNMRMLARGQSLKTNVFETVTPDTILFILDSGSFKGGDPEVFERALSVTASMIDELVKRGIRTALMTPASKWFGETCSQPSSLEYDKYKMFELLAAASQGGGGFTADAPLPADEPGRIYIICSDAGLLTIPAGILLYPEHKIRCLSTGEARGGGENMRVQPLFDFERAV